jgi:two-component system nitrogen regulation response regulator NtrX
VTARVLIVDDEQNMRRMLRALLEEEGYEIHEADGAESALAATERFDPEVILLDLIMPPGADGIAVLEQLVAQHADPVVVMMSGKATLSDAVKATRLGALQFLEKPLTPEAVLTSVGAAAELSRTRAENRALRVSRPEVSSIIGSSQAIEEVRSLISHVGPTASRVLISGESGTGKELVARAVHDASPRGTRPMITLNCAAVPRDLLESEMFGHERGAFTGAVARRHGRFELADRSSLFLDEVGDMHLELQAKLLRVLESGVVERLGGETPRRVDVRVIAATNKDLEHRVEQQTFREDLLYRLNVFPILVPPLRDRLGDLPALVQHFAVLAGAKCARQPRVFSSAALRRLGEHEWPGNVRELANVVERLTIVGGAGPVSEPEVSVVLRQARGRQRTPPPRRIQQGLSEALESYEAELIRQAIADAGGNIAEAARRLLTDRANLYRRMRRLGLSRKDTDVS